MDEALKIDVPASEYGQAECEQLARAVIAAIREPSYGMVQAGYEDAEHSIESVGELCDTPADQQPRNIWQAMIDALLEEGK
ncbi:hypothetical protein [Sphingomonas soli]|uniref:hypothetical protein n=1 Tax=Sphingomonas soli TaxID=266127 RepID=UPI00082A81DB|nr:hypothetical protein [Sphingomonas soli]